jgi:acetyl-CoA carboxylase biotin carboxyl carrier protein
MAVEDVISEVKGKVWQIEAKVGDKLDEDDAVIVLESMKMEIPVAAPADGTVKEILVKEGDPVDEGQVVATIEV